MPGQVEVILSQIAAEKEAKEKVRGAEGRHKQAAKVMFFF